MTSDPEKWDRIYRDSPDSSATAADVLAQNIHLLPHSGTALDLACGRGGNALLMASRGLDTWAWDSSEIALGHLRQQARTSGLTIHAEQRDVVAQPPLPDSFDVLVVSRFLDRDIAPALVRALRPGGLLFYQTFVADAVNESGPRNPAYRLQTNELLRLFATLQIVVYREEGVLGDVTRGFRNEAMLVARLGGKRR